MKSKPSWIIIILGTLVMVVVMSITGKPLKIPATPRGIIDLELSFHDYEVYQIVNTWRYPYPGMPRIYVEGRDNYSVGLVPVAKKNTYYDFIFIFFYTALFYMLCKASVRWLNNHGHTTFAGSFLSKAVIVSAFLDVIENVGMLINLSGNTSATAAAITFTASILKWSIVALTILYLLTFAIYFGIFSKKKKIR